MLKMALSLQTSSENRLQCSCVFCCVPVRSAVLLCILPCSCVFCRALVCFVCSAVLLCVLPCSCVFCNAPVCSAVMALSLQTSSENCLQCSCVFCRVPVCSAVLLCVCPAPVFSVVLLCVLCVLPCSCVFCRAPVFSAVLLRVLCVLSCSCVFCRAPVFSAVLLRVLCVLLCACVFCSAPVCCAVLLSVVPCSCGHQAARPQDPPQANDPQRSATERAPPKIRQNEDPQGFAKPSAARRSATTTTATTRTAEHRSTAEQEHGRTHRSTAEHTPHARRHARYDIPARQTNNRAYFTRLVDKSDASRSCPVRFLPIAISPETSSQK